MKKCKWSFYVLIAILSSMMLGESAYGQTYVLVDSFDIEFLEESGDYLFTPTCGGKPCAEDLYHHIYEWEFGIGDYSLEPTPKRKFSHAVESVTLRVTGLKQLDDIDGEKRIGKDITKECVPLNDCIRTTHTIVVDDPEIVAVEFLDPTEFGYLGTFGNRRPIPEDIFTIPVVFYNPCSSSVQYDNCKLECTLEEDGLETALDVIGYLPNCGEASVCWDPSDPSSFTLEPGELLVVLAQVKVNVTAKSIDKAYLKFRLSGTTIGSCSINSTFLDFDSLLIEGSIDPNEKYLKNKRVFEAGDIVTYEIHFENISPFVEGRIEVLDTLDPRFDHENAKVESVIVKGIEIEKGDSPTESYYSVEREERLLHVRILLRDEDQIGQREGGRVVLSVPIRTDTDFVSTGVHWAVCDSLRCDSTCVFIPNVAYTKFGDEETVDGKPVWHPCEADYYACVKPYDYKPKFKLPWAIWGSIFIGLLLMILGILRRRRVS